MKTVQSPSVTVPVNKPEPPAQAIPASPGGGAAAPSFQDIFAQSQPVPRGRLENGQKVPPPPARKPLAPMLLADGTQVPLPGRKPEVPAARLAGTGSSPAERIVLASQRVAGLSGHSYAAILAQATQESGLDPSARNRSSSAAGPFQFLERTWLDLFRRHGAAYGQGDLARQIQSRNGIPIVKDPAVRKKILDLRHDVDISAGMAARYLSEGRARLEKQLKRPVTEVESRIAYVMGAGGAAKLIRAAESTPRAVAASLLPAAARANHNLFHDRATGRALTAAETIARLTRRMESMQKDMFAAIDDAERRRERLDDSSSPMNAFQTAALGEEGGALG